MFFLNNNYNLPLIAFLFIFIILIVVIYISDYEKGKNIVISDSESGKQKHVMILISIILGGMGFMGVIYMIFKNMNQGSVKIFGMDVERGLIIYIFMCFLLAFSF